jgi:hypothetical protein
MNIMRVGVIGLRNSRGYKKKGIDFSNPSLVTKNINNLKLF